MMISMSSSADPVAVNSGDTIETVLTAYIGKRVSITIKSGGELGGKIISVGENLTHLGEITGKEFYDAVIVNQNIEAVTIRVK